MYTVLATLIANVNPQVEYCLHLSSFKIDLL